MIQKTSGAAVIFVCIFGCLKEIRPTTSVLTDFLNTSKQFEITDIYGRIYAVVPYAQLAFLIPICLLTDLVTSKPVVAFEAFCYVVTWALLIWGTSLEAMQIMQVFFACGLSAKVAYSSYVYSVTSESNYRRATSCIAAASLIGKCASHAVTQFVLSTKLFSDVFDALNNVSLASVAAALALAILLPTASKTHPQNVESKCAEENGSLSDHAFKPNEACFLASSEEPWGNKVEFFKPFEIAENSFLRAHCSLILTKLRTAYSNPSVLKWSIWSALGLAGFLQVGNCIQPLWKQAYGSEYRTKNFNGLVGVLTSLFGAVVTYFAQYLKLSSACHSETFLAISAGTGFVLLLFLAKVNSIIILYLLYFCFHATYQLTSTVATCNVALSVPKNSQALILGCNTFVALLAQSVISFLVSDAHGPYFLRIQEQFVVYAIYQGAIAVGFAVTAAFLAFRSCLRSRSRATSGRISTILLKTESEPAQILVVNDIDVRG